MPLRHPFSQIVLFLLLAAALPVSAQGQDSCPAAGNPDTQEGWVAFRANRVDEAREHFSSALSTCPDHVGARTGMAYVELRAGQGELARSGFQWVLERSPENVDAMLGLGILAWRRGDLREVDRWFRRVEEMDPGNATAADYLGRIPPGLGTAPERTPLIRPDTLVYRSRAHGDALEVRGSGGWELFYVKGVNLGAALPGRNPSEFPDSTVYARWLQEMGEMGVNTIRLYTIHPPYFYQALAEYNSAHPERPLWILHGVWAELPPGNDYLDPDWEEGFFQEMRWVVDLAHGRADVPPRPGHASGFYTADVSPWVLGWILGREWEPFSVEGFGTLHPEFLSWEGKYLTVRGGNAMDAWMGKAVEETVRYEMDRYHEQRPVSYTNWPTLDPLTHPTETTVAEEMAIRTALGETVDVPPKEYDNDAISLDAMLLRPSEAFPAGVFATFHAYPYYPDFMVHSPAYRAASSPLGPSDYFGYLQDLKRHHDGMPVVIAEYGVPASMGISHLQPQGWHHGGHDEASMAAIDRRLTLEIAESGMAGGAVFAWIDEWFKKNWIVLDFELPPERNRLWLNRLDAEQHYGMVAMEPISPVAGESLDERLDAWSQVPALYEDPSGPRLRAAADAAYLWLNIAFPRAGSQDAEVMVAFDLVDPARGDFRWPGRVGPELPVGAEFALVVRGGEARILADPSQNPFRQEAVGGASPAPETRPWTGARDVPGFFAVRAEQRFNLPFRTVANEDGVYDSLRVITNRRRFSRDSTETLALGYDRGILRPGEPPDGLWSWSSDGRVLEVRIPWMLLNFTDPSRLRVLQGNGETAGGGTVEGPFPTEVIQGIRIVLGERDPEGVWSMWPRSGNPADVASFRWPGWDEPRWTSRRRPAFRAMQDAFAELDRRGPGPGARPGDEQPPGAQTLEAPPSPQQVPELEAQADRAWNEGDTDTARRLYQEILAADSTRSRALHRVALISAWNDEHDLALSLLDRLLAEEPDNLDASVDRARVLAWRGDVGDAIGALDRILEAHPDLPQALEARAQFQSWTGEYGQALSSYQELLGISSDPTGVLLAQARVLGWASRLDESRTVYDSVLAANPGNLEARLGLARVLAFSDETEEAVSSYQTILQDHPDNQEARRGLAQALTWGGDLPRGEEAWRSALHAASQEVASRVGLAQNLRWQGRNAAALELLLAAGPEDRHNPDLEEQLRWVHSALSPRFQVSIIDESDSDDNRMTTTRFGGQWNPAPHFSLGSEAYVRDLEQTGIDLNRRAWGVNLDAFYHLEPGWVLEGGLGGTRTDGSEANSFTAYRAGVTSPGRYPYGGAVSFKRYPLDATARLTEQGVEVGILDATGRWTPAPGWQVSAGAGFGTFRGDEDNRRVHFNGRVTHRLGRALTVGVSHRYLGFDKDLNEFYFDPDYFGLTEVVGRWSWEGGAWGILVEAAPGAQKIRSGGELAGAVRASTRVRYRVAPGREISLSGGYSSAGVQSFSTGDSDYRYRALILAGSWAFY